MTNTYKILMIEDDKLVSWSLSRDLKNEGHEVKLVGMGNDGLEVFKKDTFDLVLLDMRLPDIDGLQVLQKLIEFSPDVSVIMMTAFATVQTAVQALKLGAADFIKKPFAYEELKNLIRKTLSYSSLSREVARMRDELKEKYGIGSIVGQSESMQNVFTMIHKIAQNDAKTILITGESGTGKDLVAKAIHFESPRSQYPFLAVNCGSLPDTLLESELFGHDKGAFTDAKGTKKGLFELADKGTVLLDEIGDASASFQTKLLRFLEEKIFKRIGGTKDVKVDVRIIAATNKPLEKLVDQGDFREDLYYRLRVIPVNLVPLRERPSDIPLLINYLVDHYNKELKKKVVGIAPEALEILKNYPWPGNVREMRNAIERIMILETTEVIKPEHIPMEINRYETEPVQDVFHLPASGVPLMGVEKELIRQALLRTGGNQSQAANLLNISRHAFRYKMKKYDLLN